MMRSSPTRPLARLHDVLWLGKIGVFSRVACLIAVMSGAGCAYPARNQPADAIGDDQGYQYAKLAPDPAEDTLIIVTASGGGTRATALAMSVLQGLDMIEMPDSTTLAENVDIISSVSGGSVAAAYFALTGTGGFKRLEDEFIRKDGMTPLLMNGLNPIGLARLATNATERIDLLIDYLDKQLFEHATYQTLLDRARRPFLILNAADMVEGVPFSFTQRKMDLLCSDLSQMELATAVAASAAFPVALSPVTLKNYSPCAATEGKRWPPNWVRVNTDRQTGPFDAPSRWYANPLRTSLGRTEYAYAVGDDPQRTDNKRYIHLLDGGIADNLGILEPFRMLTTQDTLPSFLTKINKGEIKKLIFVVINARSFAPSALDQSEATPGIVDMLMASINAPIDRNTAGTANQLRQFLLDELRQVVLDDPAKEALFHALSENTVLISVDFDAISDDICRRKYHSIPTSWALEKRQVDAVLEMGQALLANDPQFADLLTITQASVRSPLPSLAEACRAL